MYVCILILTSLLITTMMSDVDKMSVTIYSKQKCSASTS